MVAGRYIASKPGDLSGESRQVPVVVGQLLASLDVAAGEEDEAALPFHLHYLGVHAGRTAMVLQATGNVSQLLSDSPFFGAIDQKMAGADRVK